MSFGKILVLLLLSCAQMTASLAVRAASDKPVLPVQGDLEPLPRQVPCSTAEFGYFFRVFVRGLDDRLPRSAVRSAYVWPQVEVRSYRNPDRLLATVPKQEYANDFKIGLLYNRWIYLDPQTASYREPPRLDVKFQTLDRDRVRVEYRQAEYAPTPSAGKDRERLVKTFGEPGAYIFEHRLGCWRLTQELRADLSTNKPSKLRGTPARAVLGAVRGIAGEATIARPTRLEIFRLREMGRV